MTVFPCFTAKFECVHTEDQILKSIYDFVHNNSKSFALQKMQEQPAVLALRVLPKDLFFHNSFVPDVYIECSTTQHGCQLILRFVLKQSVKLLLAIYSSLSMVLEIAFAIMASSGRMNVSPIIFLPLIFVLFISVLSYAGLRVSSKQVLRELSAALPHGIAVCHHLKMVYANAPFMSKK